MNDRSGGDGPPDFGDAYEILSELGSGGMGTVYLADDLKHGRRVAIKTIRRDYITDDVVERFQREIRLTAALQHPRILPLLDSGVVDGTLYYVMQYVEGESLEKRLAREGQLPLDDALRITRQVADALAYAHSNNIVHRDIKPGNIMLAGGHALVMDFGIARSFSTADEGLTAAGMPIGSPSYMSPEQISDATVVDGRSDIYSLGCVLYEMVAGQPPFVGNTIDSILRQQIAAEPTRIDVHRSTVSDPVKALLSRMLAKSPADRFKQAGEVVTAIERMGAGATLPGVGEVQGSGLFAQLKQRRLVQFVTAYAAGGWVVLEVIDQLTGNGILPPIFYPLALVLALCGLPGVFIVSWFHGARGQQRSPALERWLLAGVGLVALLAAAFTVRSGTAPDEPEVMALDALAPTEDPRRIAVLYFEDRGDAEYLAPGLTESLIDELGGIEALTIVSRNGSAQFRDTTVSSDSIGRALQVGTLVTGTVRQSGDLVRVSVQLIDASENQQLDQVEVERPRAELFELQDELAEQVALYLRGALGQELQRIETRQATTNVDAWELLQRADALEAEAEDLAALGDLESASARFASADSVLAEAEEMAPGWLEPVTRRGWLAYRQARLYGFDRDLNARWVSSGLEHAARALQRDSTDADARELRGTLRYWRYLINLTDTPGEARQLFEQAERDFEASVASNPEQASALSSLSHLLMNKGTPARAMIAARQSYEADPYLQNADVTLFRIFSAAIELPDAREARTWCDEGRRRFPDDWRFRECQVWLLTLPRSASAPPPDLEEGWENCDEVERLAPGEAREFYRKRCEVIMGMALARAGRADSARAVLERARVGREVDPIRELASFEAIARTWLGDFDEALDLLAEFLAANPGQQASYGDDDGWWLADLRQDPRYASLVGSN